VFIVYSFLFLASGISNPYDHLLRRTLVLSVILFSILMPGRKIKVMS